MEVHNNRKQQQKGRNMTVNCDKKGPRDVNDVS